MQLEAVAAAEKIKVSKAAALTLADEAAGTAECSPRGTPGETMTEMTDRMGTLERALATERWRRAGLLVSDPEPKWLTNDHLIASASPRCTYDQQSSSEPPTHL